ncbi:MAG: undecaprenyl/decaprenyl-phosphate alpha-N-acetylglucosaminyl 1-phosphate transferase [candidate division Zixibacteria bacterium]|nr:undecaprenyl/decaprenyl-phosphate alpha-N-acetylglucosaminyl 1-phosphate transferase [candidate division Zixibacteria bacterium]
MGIFVGAFFALVLGHLLKPTIFSEYSGLIAWIIAGAIGILLLGVLDDLYSVRFRYKMLVQVIVGSGLVASGLNVNLISIPFVSTFSLGWLNIPVSLLWFLVILNSINLIDGMDGLAAGVSVIAGLTLLVVGIHYNAATISFLMIALVGALLAFLRFNFSPARIFMGDSGSLLLGYVFAVASLLCPVKSYTAVTLFVPLVALGLPLAEALVSFSRRTLRLRTFYSPDNRHFHNILLELGLKPRTAVLVLYAISVIFSGVSLLLMCFGQELGIKQLASLVLIGMVISAVAVSLLYKSHSPKRKVAA